MKLIPIESKGCENLFRHPKTQIIYFKIFRAGKGERSRSTRTTALSEAKVIADDFRLEFLGIAKIKRGKKFCGELFPFWLKRKELKRKATVESIKNSWKHLEPYIQNMLPEEITAAWWESVYVPEKRVESPDRKFFNDRKWLAMFLLSLKRDGILNTTPTLIDVDPPRAPGKVYSDAEISALLKECDDDLYLQILLAVTMGMRIGEIMSLHWTQVDLTEHTIHLPSSKTKTKKPRSFSISWSVLPCLVFRLEKQGGGYVFPSPEDQDKAQGRQGNRTAWTTCKALAGVSGRFHDLRHTFLTKAFKNSVNPALICVYAGLSLDEAMKTYLHFTVDDTRVVSTLVRF